MTLPSELDLAQLIVNTLSLEIRAEEIDPKGPLFGEGLGLDSIDGLEVGMAIKKAYGITVDGNEVKTAFHSLCSLKDFLCQKLEQVN
ncbi:MAG TPA: phosphopantetheine-binding protein [Myxococcota bacterium]|nr:phosphopantetheine-binding protein [Myxococcota bacterium]